MLSGNTFLQDACAIFVPRVRRLLVLAGFVCFAIAYALEAGFPGRYLETWVLLAGLVAGLAFSVVSSWEADETLAVGLLFAVPMADHAISVLPLDRVARHLFLYFVVPLSLLWAVRHGPRASEVGISLGDRRTTVRLTTTLLLVAICMSVVGLGFESMRRYYPEWRQPGDAVTIPEFLYNEGIIAVLMFAGEFFYRGFVLFVLSKKSFWGSIVLQALPYAFLHLGKPDIEVPYSLVAGIIFGWANLRSKSILPSLVTHALGSAIFDAFVLLS